MTILFRDLYLKQGKETFRYWIAVSAVSKSIKTLNLGDVWEYPFDIKTIFVSILIGIYVSNIIDALVCTVPKLIIVIYIMVFGKSLM